MGSKKGGLAKGHLFYLIKPLDWTLPHVERQECMSTPKLRFGRQDDTQTTRSRG